MRVLLITPHFRDNATRWMPLGPCSIAGLLRTRRHEVRLFDRMVEHMNCRWNRDAVQRRMRDAIRTFQPDLIGLSAVSPAIFDTVECVRFIRDFYQGLMVAGGPHTTALPILTLERMPGLDAVVVGEGEYPLLDLVECGRVASFPGVARLNGRHRVLPRPAKIHNLDALPFPALEILDTNYYTERSTTVVRGFNRSCACLLGSRGCPNACSFCSESLAYGRGVVFHSPEYVVENIAQVVKDLGIDGIYFYDNDFLIDRARVERICELILRNGLQRLVTWSIQARADRLEANVLKLLREAGCVRLEIGIETTDQDALDRMQKDVRAEQNVRSIRMAQRYGIRVHAYLLGGFDGETVLDYERQLRTIKRVRPDSVQWNEVKLYPGTSLYAERGEHYYETHDWTEENLTGFAARSLLDPAAASVRRQWLQRRYHPYLKRRSRWSLLRNNGPAYALVRARCRLRSSVVPRFRSILSPAVRHGDRQET